MKSIVSSRASERGSLRGVQAQRASFERTDFVLVSSGKPGDARMAALFTLNAHFSRPKWSTMHTSAALWALERCDRFPEPFQSIP